MGVERVGIIPYLYIRLKRQCHENFEAVFSLTKQLLSALLQVTYEDFELLKYSIVVPMFTTTSPARTWWLFQTKYSTQTACSYYRFRPHVDCTDSSFTPSKLSTPNCAALTCTRTYGIPRVRHHSYFFTNQNKCGSYKIQQ